MFACRRIVIASGNPGKVREIADVLAGLGVDAVGLCDLDLDVAEPDETGETFGENARDKARHYARATGQWCLADDSGLVVDALDGRPGVHSARYADERTAGEAGRDVIDAANNAKLLDELAGVPDERRTARFVCDLALAGDGKILLEAQGTVEGRIGHAPRGVNGFGYDPLFVLPHRGCTTAELPPEEKNAISHRGQAVRTFAARLPRVLGG
ncbi:MAG: RdgB/HAM1 family non-canonical purine NTP pyrophosphatase [Planctomycetes bacterium]|jgi:XTP/dITP diphosphohydrolase|nr:RdgB/HAM1 family non-canonical purine NTP pyrophosphatase [Phycisphaerae bacterium]NBB96339.1 RdgB/HAM1 family non-canonical purine NTP pyrophosphatase [Planctomycetota bacterium]